MTTFILKKYDDTTSSTNNEENVDNNNDNKDKKEEGPMITITGTISEIVANALNATFKQSINVIEQETNTEEPNAKAISTEDINRDPVETFRSIKKGDVVFIQNTGFKTAQEEWFLTNLPNKTDKVFYSIESFTNYIIQTLGVENNEG